MNYLLEALVRKLDGDIAVAKANVDVYMKGAAGIGEHPDIVESIETQISKIAEAEDKMNIIHTHFGWNKGKKNV
jgi:hypothetical protein